MKTAPKGAVFTLGNAVLFSSGDGSWRRDREDQDPAELMYQVPEPLR